MNAPTRASSAACAPRSLGLRWVALLLLAVASPCATELVLGAVAAACDDTVQVTACCPAHQAEPRPDDDGEPTSPDAQRSGCGCCHSFEPTSFTPALGSPERVVPPPVHERVSGTPVDGYRERLFRPPARA